MRTIAERQASAAARWAQAGQTVLAGCFTVDRTRFTVSHSRALLDRPRPAFSGGIDQAPDDATVRTRLRVLVSEAVWVGAPLAVLVGAAIWVRD